MPICVTWLLWNVTNVRISYLLKRQIEKHSDHLFAGVHETQQQREESPQIPCVIDEKFANVTCPRDVDATFFFHDETPRCASTRSIFINFLRRVYLIFLTFETHELWSNLFKCDWFFLCDTYFEIWPICITALL